MSFPEVGELVIVTVKKVIPYGAFCTLDEYGNVEAFLHISEVASRWIKNIREFAKEDQKLVLKVINLNLEKHQIDVSLKNVSQIEKKRKMEQIQRNKRAEKMLERASIKLKKPPATAMQEIGLKLKEAYDGDILSAFESLSADEELKVSIQPPWLEVLKEIAKAEIKPKIIEERAILKLQSYSGEGIERIKKLIEKVEKMAPKDVEMEVQYISAPIYYLNFKSEDFKAIDKTISKIQNNLDAIAKVEEMQLCEVSKEKPE